MNITVRVHAPRIISEEKTVLAKLMGMGIVAALVVLLVAVGANKEILDIKVALAQCLNGCTLRLSLAAMTATLIAQHPFRNLERRCT